MGRLAPTRTLGLWMNGARVGTWTLARNAQDTLQYDPAWVESAEGRPLSLSLPFMPGNAPHRGEKVHAYFENLLPDSREIRERLARRFNTGSIDAFDLLAEIGRDCVGALEILPEGDVSAGPAEAQARPLSDAEVAQDLRAATTPQTLNWGADEDEFRISIAGAQEKTALLRLDDRWCLPRGSTPTTHIFKLPLGLIGGLQVDMRNSVENEWLCAQILREFRLPVAACEVRHFEDVKVLVVERFDRVWRTSREGMNRLIRLPQEDMCQALGVPPGAKYEADGGPGMDQLLDLLDGSIAQEEDKRVFFKAQLIFWMLCATDGHAKNFSLHLRPGRRYQLTPLYDVLSAYPVLGEGRGKLSSHKVKMAMAVRSKNAHWKMRDILRRHWVVLGTRHGVVTEDGRDIGALIDEVVARTPSVIQAVRAQLPDDFPAEVAEAILDGLQAAADRLGVGR
ncbi:type II toxin-antitoxin system HipA family toxin [Roseateles sp. So40a]|uniref:type II toxin-antitoxin system HipA family toxin n=1 Tax=Roseateles sp. So40a TaxID=3400226 RepID=UPI003A86372F